MLLDGTIVIDAGVVTGATSITSTAFVGDITGDVTGNADTATLATTVTITDNEPPVIVCPADIAQNVDAGVAGAVVNYTDPVGTDNATGAITTRIAGPASGSTFPIGITTVTFRVEDTFGNIVATGVLALTKNASLDKKDQMQDSLARIVKQGKEVAIVKLCDRITNLQKPPLKWDKEKIKKYQLQAVVIAQALGGKNSYLDNRTQEKIKAYTAFV